MRRSDLEIKDYAISIGYEIEYHVHDRLYKRIETPLFPLTFKKFKKYIWSVKDGWMCADLVAGSFTKHRRYSDIKTALDNERFNF